MFIHKEQLEYLLSPEQYWSQQQYDREIGHLFQPAWHLVGLKTEIANCGDFKTIDLFGTPLLIRNHQDELRAYLNVCAHRHCMLTDLAQGNCPTIRCQYHGWEYQSDGRVSRVPDGGCFKPFDRENSTLVSYPLETCGDLMFVRLSANGVSLRDYLGHFYDIVDCRFQHPWQNNWHWQKTFECNWKIPVENTVETYHLPYVHEKTFQGLYPTEEAQDHDLSQRHSTLRYRLDPNHSMMRLQDRVMKLLGRTDSDYEYVHHHVYPHIVFTTSDLFSHAQVYLPTSPTTARTEIWMFALRGDKTGIIARTVAKLVARYGRKGNETVQTEDASVFSDQQRGIQNSRHPGCIGTREERIYAFQQFIRNSCGAAKLKAS